MADAAVVTVVETPPAVTKKKYNIIGLQKLESMPIEHNSVMYDLAKLTDEQAEKLVSEKCPYIVKV